MEKISIDEFKKVEIRIGEILAVEPVDGSEKLLKLKVSFGDEERQVVSGIAKYFPELGALIGKRCAFVTNLEPRTLMGLESQAMILATSDEERIYLFDSNAPLGSQAR
jgi:methionine--tRNA ligase beta chain